MAERKDRDCEIPEQALLEAELILDDSEDVQLDPMSTSQASKQEESFRYSTSTSMSQFLTHIGKYPLLKKAGEQKLGQALAECRSVFAAQMGRVRKDVRVHCMGDTTIDLDDPNKRWLFDEMDQAVTKFKQFVADEARRPKTSIVAQKRFARLNTQLDALKKTVLRYHVHREEFCNANLRLVVRVAKSYGHPGMQQIDLIHEGTIGLLTAVEKFEYERDLKFSTYATNWIKQSIGRAIGGQANIIRYPVHVGENLRKRNQITRELRQDGINVNEEVLAKHMGISVLKARRLLDTTLQPVSLSQPIGEDCTGTLGEHIVDRNSPGLDAAVHAEDLKAKVQDALKVLDEQQADIVKRRFGFDGHHPHTLLEVAALHKLSRERVRQIQRDAVNRLKKPVYSKPLEVFLTMRSKKKA